MAEPRVRYGRIGSPEGVALEDETGAEVLRVAGGAASGRVLDAGGAAHNARSYGVRTTAEEPGVDQSARLTTWLSSAAGGVAVLPPGEYLGKISVPPETMLVARGATLKLPDDQPALTPVVSINQAHGSRIQGLTVDGNRATQTSPGWQDGGYHGVRIYGSRDVILDDMLIRDCATDGIYLRSSVYVQNHPDNGDVPSENIKFRDVICVGNARNGLTVFDVYGLTCTDCDFEGSQGKSPEAGVDIEPFALNRHTTDVVFERCGFRNNNGRGLSAVLYENCHLEGLTISDCEFDNNGLSHVESYDIRVGGSAGSRVRDIIIEKCRFLNPGPQVTFRLGVFQSGGGDIRIRHVKVADCVMGPSSTGADILGAFRDIDDLILSSIEAQATTTKDAFQIVRCKDFEGRNVAVVGGRRGFFFSEMQGNALVSGGRITGQEDEAVRIEASVGVRVEKLVAGGTGANVIHALTSSAVHVVDCEIEGGMRGVFFHETVTGGVIRGGSVKGSAVNAVEVRGTGGLISDVVAEPNNPAGNYGIRLHNDSSDYIVERTDATILNTGTNNQFRGNLRYITETSGEARVTTGNLSVVKAHGLSRTPSRQDITLTPIENPGGPTAWWVSDITASNFRINVDTPPAAGVTFAYTIVVR